MEGPTPVSALLHSCTLVMAGIFVALELTSLSISNGSSSSSGSGSSGGSSCCSPLKAFLVVISSSSVFACVFASSSELDSKRLVAYSTVSIVSLLWLALSLASCSALVSIAVLHASYKSSLFVTVGRLISSSEHASVGSFSSVAVIAVHLCLLVAAVALSGSSYSVAKHSLLTCMYSSSSSGSLSGSCL